MAVRRGPPEADVRDDDRARSIPSLAANAGEEPLAAVPVPRVLVVEDNALVASMYEAALRKLSSADRRPLAIELARDGGEAFARLLRAPPVDLVLTDVFMPAISGVALVEQIRAAPLLAALPVIVATSGGANEEARLAALGVARFLRKPVSFEALADAVREVLRASAPPAGATGSAGLTPREPMAIHRLHAIPVSRR
ncbi:response regulator [Anaeromyxobacter terrae]|uniref:response regulator n=1 Tax=Anaeromyxobacter terrae TaxID=2925406 RepID=UPI001F5696AE|nr:response regulator [Anaeromyxobacter sp. SG22]